MAFWFVSNDSKQYTVENIEALKEEYSAKNLKITEIILLPTKDNFNDFKPFSNNNYMAFIAPYFPQEVFPLIGNTSFFEIIRLDNLSKDGIRTYLQESFDIPIEKALSAISGSDIFFPKETLADYGSNTILSEEVEMIRKRKMYKMPIKGYFLAGIPGTGKSFWVKCLAGELGYAVVPLSISKIKKENNPEEALYRFFKLFSMLRGNYILWIDEIEKMLKGKESQEIIGELLTILSDNNSDGESSYFVVATANNIDELAKSNSEFFRDGRWDEVFFLLPPFEESAKHIFDIYLGKKEKILLKESIPLSIYYAFSGKDKGNRSRLQKIANLFLSKNIISHDEVLSMEESQWIKKCQEKEMQEQIRKVLEPYSFVLDIQRMIRAISETFRNDTVIKEHRFAYTPAEIMRLIERLYEQLYLKEDITIDYYAVAEGTQPLQKKLKDSIMSMMSRSKDFKKV